MYWSSYLADTRRLSTLEHGAYMLLIAEYWQSGKPLPDDDGVLARVAGLTKAKWLSIRATIAAFFVVADSLWTHGRVEEELQIAQDRYERRSAAGHRGGVAKAVNNRSNATAMPEQCASKVQGTGDKEELSKPLKEGFSQSGFSPHPPGAQPFTPAQKRDQWKWNMCKEALATMQSAEYERFTVDLMADEPWAVARANEMDRAIRARKSA